MARIKVVLNPTAGMKSAAAKIPLIESLLQQHHLDYELVLTERRGHAIEIAERTDPNECSVIVAAGGDGTCNEVLNGLMRAKQAGRSIPSMGALPIGRGNDYAHGMGLPPGLEQNIDVLAANFRKPMDVGLVHGGLYPDGRYFGNGIGVGFSTIVGFEAAKLKFIHGFITYVFGAISTLFLYYHAPLLRMRVDGEEREQRCIENSIMIGTRFGGTFFIAPHALNDDGLFDLVIAKDTPRLSMLKLITKYMKGTQNESPLVSTERVQKIALTALDGSLAVHADGETICEQGTSIDVECLHHAITIVTQSPSRA